MSGDTQPLAEPDGIRPYPNATSNFEQMKREEAIEKAVQRLNETHRHHFTYLLNQGHTALRGCSCGLAHVGLMYGDVKDLKWHQVHEEGA